MSKSAISFWPLAVWLLVNLFQSAFTELANDEAYYWMYSKFLDVGYFDHPPLIAVLIKIGYALFPNELGVRLLVVMMSLGTILVCHEILGRRHLLELTLLMSAIPIFQVYGFIAVPDAPLIFFASAFFLAYKKYLSDGGIANGLFLAIAIVGMLYSKYHGVLVVLLTLASNWRLLKQSGTYWIALAVIAFYSPHIYWQIINDYPSVKYHLLERSMTPYKLAFTFEYLLGQALILGPLVSIPLFIRSFKKGSDDEFARALKFNLIGVLVFFLFSSFKGRVEANWTAVAAIPLVLLALNEPFKDSKWWVWTSKLAMITLVVLLIARVHLMDRFLPDSWDQKNEFSGWQQWANEVESLADGKPVVFVNSYQKASKYTFYTGQIATASNTLHYRKNQYDLWPIADSIQGHDVLWVSNWPSDWLDRFMTSKGVHYYWMVDNFQSFEKINVEVNFLDSMLVAGETARLLVTLENHFGYVKRFDLNDEYPIKMEVSLYKENQPKGSAYDQELRADMIIDTLMVPVQFDLPKKPGTYNIRVGLSLGRLGAIMNSRIIPFDVVEQEVNSQPDSEEN